MQNATNLENFFAHWLSYAQEINLDFFTIRRVKGAMFQAEYELSNCFSDKNYPKRSC